MDPRALTSFRAGAAFIRKTLNPELPNQQFALIMEVAARPGVTMPEIAKVLQMSSASVSKNIRALSRYKEGKTIRGYDMVFTTPNMDNRRRFSVYLTKKGEKWIEQFFKTVYGSREDSLPYITIEAKRLGLKMEERIQR